MKDPRIGQDDNLLRIGVQARRVFVDPAFPTLFLLENSILDVPVSRRPNCLSTSSRKNFFRPFGVRDIVDEDAVDEVRPRKSANDLVVPGHLLRERRQVLEDEGIPPLVRSRDEEPWRSRRFLKHVSRRCEGAGERRPDELHPLCTHAGDLAKPMLTGFSRPVFGHVVENYHLAGKSPELPEKGPDVLALSFSKEKRERHRIW